MNVFQNKKYFSGVHTKLGGALTAFSMVLISSGISNAQDQSETFMDFSHPNVTVDLSVISDGGYQQSATVAAPTLGMPAGRILLLPGGQAPSSMLHLPTVGGAPLPQLKKPKKVQAVAKVPTPTPAPEPVVAKAPEIKVAPAPAKVEPAEVAETPKKLEAPAKPTVSAPVVKAEEKSPPPPAVVKPAVTVAKQEAPKAPKAPPAPEAKKSPETQQAALPPAKSLSDTGSLRVAFPADQTKLPAAAKDRLKALANKMKGQDNMRLQLMAYAGGESLSSSLARRMSLSRALSVRSFLIENGVRSTRIDVRALGNKTTEEPLNRVDLNVAER
jgi:outer membrane protein OmpA-like peptidoglycan-associated protein